MKGGARGQVGGRGKQRPVVHRMKSDGMPDMTPEEKKASIPALIGSVFVPFLIGFGLAHIVWYGGDTDIYRVIIAELALKNQHWVYFAAVVFGRTIAFLNFYPAMMWKSQIMRGKSGNLRANPFIYKMIGDNPLPNKIVFEDEGDIGAYNRANRSTHHMVENFGVFVIGLYMAGTVFGPPMFVLTCFFCIGRIMHQVGYTTKYGGHGIGFTISLLSTLITEGLLFIVALKGFGVNY